MKWLAIALISIILLAVGVKILSKQQEIKSVRIAYGLSGLTTEDIDPAKIEVIQQALLIDNLYGHLVEYDDNGALQAGIAETFYWRGNSLVFEFSKKVKTQSGRYIDANDAAASIRRALKLGQTTHSDLSYFLCPNLESNRATSACEAVTIEGNKLVLNLKDEKFKPFVLQTMAADDYVIVPEDAIEKNSLKIKDFKQTSGPYYLESAAEDKWILKKNSEHYALLANSPSEVILVNTDPKSASDLFIDDEVDIITTLNNLTKKKFSEIEAKVPDLHLSKTMDIKLFYMQFSPKAQKELSLKNRVSLAGKFRQLMDQKYSLPIFANPTNRFFLDQSSGKLSNDQVAKLDPFLRQSADTPFVKKVTFYFYKSLAHLFNIFREIPEIDPIEVDHLPFSQKLEDRLDLFLATTDTSYGENLSLLNYNFTQGTFGLNKDQGNAWLDKYISLQDPEERSQLLQSLHFDSLTNGVIFPLYKAPYTAIGRNGFRIRLSPIYASTHFWKIEKN